VPARFRDACAEVVQRLASFDGRALRPQAQARIAHEPSEVAVDRDEGHVMVEAALRDHDVGEPHAAAQRPQPLLRGPGDGA
jgi:hypothetical protein